MSKLEKTQDIVSQLAIQAKEYHRRGNVVLRNQTEKQIYDAAPSVAYAKKVIAELYR